MASPVTLNGIVPCSDGRIPCDNVKLTDLNFPSAPRPDPGADVRMQGAKRVPRPRVLTLDRAGACRKRITAAEKALFRGPSAENALRRQKKPNSADPRQKKPHFREHRLQVVDDRRRDAHQDCHRDAGWVTHRQISSSSSVTAALSWPASWHCAGAASAWMAPRPAGRGSERS